MGCIGVAQTPWTGISVRSANDSEGAMQSHFSLNELLTPELELFLIDVGAMGEGQPRYQPLLNNFATTMTGFEPNPSEFRKLASDDTTRPHRVPDAIHLGFEFACDHQLATHSSPATICLRQV